MVIRVLTLETCFGRGGGGVQDAHYLNNIQMPGEMFFRANTIQVAVQ